MKEHTKCYLCDAETEKVSLLISEKLLHKTASKVYCLDCLADYLGMTVEELFEKWSELTMQKHN
ncbi:MAG: hypothetical protein FWG68_03295 [Defluviitaleaceae bacterium]|nr:hypothetical protein [Defluviitaleaceae bacterium]